MATEVTTQSLATLIKNSPFQSYTVKELRDEVRKNSLHFRGAVRKSDLIELLVNQNIQPDLEKCRKPRTVSKPKAPPTESKSKTVTLFSSDKNKTFINTEWLESVIGSPAKSLRIELGPSLIDAYPGLKALYEHVPIQEDKTKHQYILAIRISRGITSETAFTEFSHTETDIPLMIDYIYRYSEKKWPGFTPEIVVDRGRDDSIYQIADDMKKAHVIWCVGKKLKLFEWYDNSYSGFLKFLYREDQKNMPKLFW